MTSKIIRSAVKSCEDSLAKLREAVGLLDKKSNAEFSDVLMDAAIKRFEVAFEYSWKLMKAVIEHEGSEAYGPRPAIQEANRLGLIDDPEYWAVALDARNGSVHDYLGITHDEYLKVIKKFIKENEKLLVRTKK
jgi:nucleotidyltransferase substrate binding protein (TIGR01987 family)